MACSNTPSRHAINHFLGRTICIKKSAATAAEVPPPIPPPGNIVRNICTYMQHQEAYIQAWRGHAKHAGTPNPTCSYVCAIASREDYAATPRATTRSSSRDISLGTYAALPHHDVQEIIYLGRTICTKYKTPRPRLKCHP